jgi:glucose/arabinose dehydrogenase
MIRQFSRCFRTTVWVAVLTASSSTLAQEPEIGIAPVTLDRDSYTFDTAEQHGIRVDVLARGIPHPFSFTFLPNGDALVVERGANLRIVRAATSANPRLDPAPVPGAPAPGTARGEGLADIAAHPDFARNGLVYFTYNRPGAPDPSSTPPGRRPTAITLARARFDGNALVGGEDIFIGEERMGSSGSRIAFGPDSTVYLTTGAPFDDAAQSPDNVYGKVLRIYDDGRIPTDNPFVGVPGARAEVYSLGHRDQLGLTVHAATGTVFAAEHGPNGGDEVNLILPGRNYGWPNFSYGRSYEGPRISAVPLGSDTEQPQVLWVPSIAPTGMTFYTAERIPAWTGNLFVGSARRGEIPRTGGLERVVLNENFEELRRESLLGDLHQRIRDVRQGPDGLLYVITDEDDGALLRISPTR